MSYQNNQNRGPANYLRSSSLTKTLHFNNEIDNDTGKPRKERTEFSDEVTEEISITLTAQKAQDLINRIVAAQNDQSGTGGVRISMYCRKSQNQSTGEVFDGMGILIYAQKPPQNGQGGSFQGRGNFRGGGRRSYPPQQTQGYGQPRQNGGYARPNAAASGTNQNQGPVAPQSGGPAGRGPTAPRSASPSKKSAAAPVAPPQEAPDMGEGPEF